MILKGLSESFKPFSIHIKLNHKEITFSKFKTKLRRFKNTERSGNSTDDIVMKINILTKTKANATPVARMPENVLPLVSAENRLIQGCKSSTHKDVNCRFQRGSM